jgi:KaiC/GvpD/RAD55 family RecA-like ATPase
MTKRAKQHQLEDLSRSKYSLAIPKNWVFRHKDKDYGIDAEVEIFDQNDRTTGLVYWIQLKATENNTESRARKVDLSLDSMRYYKSLDIPVMIVRYSAIIDRFYYKWAHEIDLFFEHNKKS